MKKSLLLTIVASSFYVIGMNAQEVITTSGGYGETTTGSLSWTIGEPVIETVSNSNNSLTQGFQQASYSVTGIKKSEDLSFQIKVFPNPASDLLNVAFITKEKPSVLIELFDLNGKILFDEQVESTHLNKQINFTHYTPGTYFLRIRETSGKLLVTYQIQKIIR